MGLIPYMGGKKNLSKKIISLMPPHQVYIEPFFGSGAIFFGKTKAKVNIINDIDSNLINLFIVLRDRYDELVHWCQHTPISRKLFNEYRKQIKNGEEKDPIQRAGKYLYVLRLSFNGKFGIYFSPHGEKWNREWMKSIKLFAEKLDGVVIENVDFECLKKYDQKDALMYLDPPYYISNRSDYYVNLFSESDHLRLFRFVSNLTCKWIMSYDDNEYITNLYKDFNIIRVTNLATSGSINKNDMLKRELIITNFKQYQQELFNGAVL